MNNIINPYLNIKKAIVFSVLSALFLSLMGALVKTASQQASLGVIISARFSISLSYILLIILIKKFRGEVIAIITSCLKFNIYRGVAATTSMGLLFLSLHHAPFLEVNLLFASSPLFVPILALLIMKVHTPIKLWLAILLGFVGVIFILHPDGHDFNLYTCIALGSGIAGAFSALYLRQSAKHDHPYSIMLYYFSIALTAGLILLIFHRVIPHDWLNWIILIGVGIAGILNEEFYVRASKYAPARVVSSLMYSNVAISGLLGFWIWGEMPNYYVWLGIILITAGALFVIHIAAAGELQMTPPLSPSHR